MKCSKECATSSRASQGAGFCTVTEEVEVRSHVRFHLDLTFVMEPISLQTKLFKRDFAGEIMSRHKDFELVDYGFVYHGASFPQDDVNWFLLRKPE